MPETVAQLTPQEHAALTEIKRRVSAIFDVRRYVLFGSRARGDATSDSDIDLLIVTERELEHCERHMISHEIFEVNLERDTQFSFLCIDAGTWESELHGYMPLHVNVTREGIPV
jgi:predicted nucleotidyltransferase